MTSIAQKVTENTKQNLAEDFEEEISNNEISRNEIIARIQKTLGNKVNILSKEQLEDFCNKLTIHEMAKNEYNKMITEKQINKLNDGSICINVNGKPYRKFKNQRDVIDMKEAVF
jgi:predicted transcriptional regulator YdeE